MKADVFAAGIILYIISAGIPPFTSTKSSPKNGWWAFFRDQRLDEFWANRLSRDRIPHTPEFKDLIGKMLFPEEERRISIPEIKQHAYWHGPTATLPEIQESWKLRQFKLDLDGLKDKYQKEKDRSVYTRQPETKKIDSKKSNEWLAAPGKPTKIADDINNYD
jgi:serine/threonine protein kinase